MIWLIILLAGLLIALILLCVVPLSERTMLSKSISELLDSNDRRLLYLALNGKSTQAELDDFLSGWDIEAAPIKSVMLLAYVMHTRPDMSFPASVKPRLEGVLKFCRFKNLKQIAHFCKVADVLGGMGIPLVILKGGAMKVYRPDFPRWMNDIDVMVPPEDYEKAVQTTVSLGYANIMRNDHSTDFRMPNSQEGFLDIHRHLELFAGNETAFNEGLFSRASKKRLFNSEGLLPCPEDMVFVSLVNLYKNLSKRHTPESVVTSFFDLKYLTSLDGSFDWNIVKESVIKTDTAAQVSFVSKLVSLEVPGIIPQSFLDSVGATPKEFEKQFVDFYFNRDVFSAGRDSFASTKLGAATQGKPNILIYAWVYLVKFIKLMFSSIYARRLSLRLKFALGGDNQRFTNRGGDR